MQGFHTGVFNFPVAEQLLNNEGGIGEPVDAGLAGIKVIVVKIAGEPVETGDDGVVFGLVIGFFCLNIGRLGGGVGVRFDHRASRRKHRRRHQDYRESRRRF